MFEQILALEQKMTRPKHKEYIQKQLGPELQFE